MKNEPEKTEIVPTGELSSGLKSALKAAGERIEVADIAGAFTLTENSRNTFTTHALMLGMMLLAKKQSIPHGKFRKFCEDSVALSRKAKVTRMSLLKGGDDYRSAARYMHLARRVLCVMERPDQRNPLGMRYLEMANAKATPTAEHLTQLAAKQEQGAVAFIDELVGDWSLADLMRHLNESAKAADEEEASSRRARGEPAQEDARQTSFFDLLQDDLRHLDERLGDPDFFRADPKDLEKFAAALEERARQVRSKIKQGPEAK